MLHKDKALLDTLWKRYVIYYAPMFTKMPKARIWTCLWPLRLDQSWPQSKSGQEAKIPKSRKLIRILSIFKWRNVVNKLFLDTAMKKLWSTSQIWWQKCFKQGYEWFYGHWHEVKLGPEANLTSFWKSRKPNCYFGMF